MPREAPDTPAMVWERHGEEEEGAPSWEEERGVLAVMGECTSLRRLLALDQYVLSVVMCVPRRCVC